MKTSDRYLLSSMSLIVLGLLFVAGSNTRAEVILSIYGGVSSTSTTTVRLEEPPGTSLRFADVSWRAEPFKEPVYYGYRIGFRFPPNPRWAVFIDFTHAKMISSLDQTVSVTGTRNNQSVSTNEHLGATFQGLEFSHGHNILTANVRYMLFEPVNDGNVLSRVIPFVGTGVGIAITHVEVETSMSQVNEYQITGPAFQGLIGLTFDITEFLLVFAEYKVSYASMAAQLQPSGTVGLQPWTHHSNLGLEFAL